MRCCRPWAGRRRLNCALDLHKHGVLDKYGVEMIGATHERHREGRRPLKFKEAMTSIGLESAR